MGGREILGEGRVERKRREGEGEECKQGPSRVSPMRQSTANVHIGHYNLLKKLKYNKQNQQRNNNTDGGNLEKVTKQIYTLF